MSDLDVRVLRAVAQWFASHRRCCPTARDISDYLDNINLSTVTVYLRWLEQKGYVQLRHGTDPDDTRIEMITHRGRQRLA